MSNNLKLICCGGVGNVTGANFLLKTDNTSILVDCGLIQGFFKKDDPNQEPFPYNPKDIDYLFITHAHLDHIGRIGKLVKDGFRGEIYSTPATKELAFLMLEDALGIQTMEAQKRNEDPIYSKTDLELAFSLWKTIEYHEEKTFGDFKVYPKDAGHILGSVIYEITDTHTNKKIVFTGDLGNTPTPLLRPTEKITDADYVVMESVYGDSNHEDKPLRHQKLKDALNKVIKRNGALIIPVFSLEKTQVLLHELDNLIEEEEIPSVPVFLDSPLGIKVTEVYAKYLKNYNENIQEEIRSGDDIFDFPKLKMTLHKNQSQGIHKTRPPFILIASSGISEGGRITEHEKRYLPGKENALIMIGYQIAGSLGRKIKEGEKVVIINNEKVRVNAEIISIDGYSSHKDSDGLFNFVENTKDTVKKVFVVMGEPKSSLFLSQKIRDNLNIDAIVPEPFVEYEL